jgi:hypothetical protein
MGSASMNRILAVAFSVMVISMPALAQTRVMTTHDQTASALKCLLDHDRNDCKYHFVGTAYLGARYWLWWNSNKEVALGPVLSSEYAGTQAQNAYTTKFVSGRTADLYDVKFRRQELTFYIVPPDSDGNVRYMHIRSGAPNDEKMHLFVTGPG